MDNVALNPSSLSEEDPRVKRVLREIQLQGKRADSLIQILHYSQEVFGYLPLPLLVRVARELRLPRSRVFGVVTFYHLFSLRPKGEHNCLVCMGTACYVKGAPRVLEALEKGFSLHAGEVSADGHLSVQTARCLGACGLAPALVVDDAILARVTPEGVVETIKEKIGSAAAKKGE